MFRKNTKFDCGFGASAAEYIYGELAEERLSAFESHLAGCDACISELAEVSEARFEVYEWRKFAFDPLLTPIVRIPYHEPVRVGLGLTGRVSQFLSVSRVWTVGGLAVAGVAVASWMAISVVTPSADVIRVANTSAEAPAAPMTAEVSPLIGDAPSSPAAPEKRGGAAVRAGSANARPAAPRPVRTQIAAVRVPVRGNTARQTAAPLTLSGYSAEEDPSLRLAEVFDDIGSE